MLKHHQKNDGFRHFMEKLQILRVDQLNYSEIIHLGIENV